MKILLSGSTGFLGKIIYKELQKFGNVISVSRRNSIIKVDLVKQIPSLPDTNLVIHCAGKAHSMPKNEMERQAFFDVNLTGTNHLLKGLEQSPSFPRYFVFISTVAVYGINSGSMIDENAPLLANDAYGQSKIQAEELIQNWCSKNNVICSILRVPLLVGRNPPGNLGAMIKGIKKGYYFDIGGGKAKKSMVLASDVARIIPIVAKVGGVYNLTDGHHPSFSELSTAIAKQLGKKKPINIPLWIGKIMAYVGTLLGSRSPININKLNKITEDLTFDDNKARSILGWKPYSVLEKISI